MAGTVQAEIPWMEPISKFLRRIIAPIAEWLDSGGFEKIAIGLGFLFLFAVIMTAIVLFAGDVLGVDIFGSGKGCTNPDPYHPCRPVDTP